MRRGERWRRDSCWWERCNEEWENRVNDLKPGNLYISHHIDGCPGGGWFSLYARRSSSMRNMEVQGDKGANASSINHGARGLRDEAKDGRNPAFGLR